MSFDKFIQSRTIAKQESLSLIPFPTYRLSSFIDFETDGFLVGIHFMLAHNIESISSTSVDFNLPAGGMVAKVSGDLLSIPAGGDITDYSGAQILISTLNFPSQATTQNDASRQTTIAYDADSKRIPIKSNDRLGVYLCSNGEDSNINFAYTLTAYFVRS